MAVGELERLAERFVNQGIGTSPVASRVIQQAQLQGPEVALAESNATRNNQRISNLSNFALRLSMKAPTGPKMRRDSGFNKLNPFFISNSSFNSNGTMPKELANVGRLDPRTGKIAVAGLDVNDPKNKALIDLAKQQILFNNSARSDNHNFVAGDLSRPTSSLSRLASTVGDTVSQSDLAKAIQNIGGF